MSSKSQSCLSDRTIAGSFSASSKSSLRRGASRAIRSLRTPPIVTCRQHPLSISAGLPVNSPWGAFAIFTRYLRDKGFDKNLLNYVGEDLISFLAMLGWLRKGCFGSLKKKYARLRTTKWDRRERPFYSPGSTDTPRIQVPLVDHRLHWIFPAAETRVQSGLLYGSADLGSDCAIARDTWSLSCPAFRWVK